MKITSVLGFFFNHLKSRRQLQVIAFLTGVLQLGICTSNCGTGILAMSHRMCGIPHLLLFLTHTFSRESKGTIFTWTSMADQITFMSVTDQITPATTNCSPVRRGGIQRGEKPHWQNRTEGVGRGRLRWEKANESFFITKCPV